MKSLPKTVAAATKHPFGPDRFGGGKEGRMCADNGHTKSRKTTMESGKCRRNSVKKYQIVESAKKKAETTGPFVHSNEFAIFKEKVAKKC